MTKKIPSDRRTSKASERRPESVERRLEVLELFVEEAGRYAQLVDNAAHDARARFIEAERQRPRRGRAPLPAGLSETHVGPLVLVEGPPQHVRVRPDLARAAEGLRAVFDLELDAQVLPELAEAVEAAKQKLEDVWISQLIHWLTLAVADREQRRRHPGVPSFPMRPVQWWIGADLRPPPFGGLSVAPPWLTKPVTDWLLAQFAPTRPRSKGGGRGKLNEATIRRLVKNRHELARKIEASDPDLAARVRAEI